MKTQNLFMRGVVKQGLVSSIVLTGLMLCSLDVLKAAVVTVNPTDDTLLINLDSASESYTNFGAEAVLGASLYANSLTRGEYSLLRFDLSAIPIATITGATLKLTVHSGSVFSGYDFSVWQNAPGNDSWVEGTGPVNDRLGATARYQNQTSYTDPNNNAGTPWASNGLYGASDLGSLVGSIPWTSPAVNTTVSISLNPSDLNLWLTNPALANAGLSARLTGAQPASSLFLYFYSMESGQPAAFLPQLDITYDAIPEGNTVIYLAIAGVVSLLITRRRSVRNSVPYSARV